jgi:cellulose synthase/poly-beta-1,6-N-acetylglucosamine synthase-like glycosyltransferase
VQALNYPKDKFDIVVMGDSLQPETYDKLNELPIILFPVIFDKSTKARSLNLALSILPEVYDYALILDVDNHVYPDFLQKMNACLQGDKLVLQAHRTAKNTNTAFAILDAISEEINNVIFRKGHVAIGLSSSLIGSGKAIQYAYFKKAMANITSAVEDKELELNLIQDQIHIHYEDHLYVYDEKVASAKIFTNQRKRWVASQFFNFFNVVTDGFLGLILKGNVDYFDKCLQRIILPRVLILGLSFVLSILYFISYIQLGYYFALVFVVCLLTYLLSIPPSFFTIRTFLAAMHLPQAFVLMLWAVIKSKGSAKNFNATPKTFKKN